jgi:hypothetical protein
VSLITPCQTLHGKQTEWNAEVLELFNTIQYLGGEKVANFVRGPMGFGMGRGGVHQCTFTKANLGGPSRNARAKVKSGYTTQSGVQKCLVQTLHTMTKTVNAPIDDTHVRSIPVAVASDGTALKPAFEFDSRQKLNIGLDEPVSLQYVKAHPDIAPDQLKKTFFHRDCGNICDGFVQQGCITICCRLRN